MKSSIDVLDSYAEAFRDLVNAKVWSGPRTIRELLRLNNERDWYFICTAMDVVGDASAAVRNFLQFGLDGPTRYQDVGERYLRLYGLLSATYIQEQAVLKLYELMKVPNPKNVKTQLEALKVRDLRHKLASHSTDYIAEKGKQIQTYVPIRMGLAGFHCLYADNERSKQESVDLEEGIEEHCRLLISTLDSVYEKAFRTLYKGQQKRLDEFSERLADLRTERDGGLVLRFAEDEKLVIHTFAQENLTHSTRTRRKRRAG